MREIVNMITEAVTVRPGDILVLRVSSDFAEGGFEEARERISAEMPDGVKVLFVGGSIEQIACIRGT